MAQVSEWIAAVVESPVAAVEDGESFQPAVIVWFEPETGAVVDITVTRPELADAPALFARVTEQPKDGPPRTPRRVRVADPVLAEVLRGRIGDVEVVVGDISEAREAVESLAQYMSRMAPLEPANDDATLDLLDESGMVDPERMARYRSALMTRLAAREEITDEVLAAAEMLVELAAHYHGVTFGTITTKVLEALLLETVPAQIAVEPDEAGRIIAAARELMRFAGEELGSAAAPDALAMLDPAFETRLAHELANPANFAPGKQLVMAGIAAGYDMSTEEGVEEFVRAFAEEQRTQREPKAKGKAKAKAKAKAKGKAKTKAKAKARAQPKANAQPRVKAQPNTKAKPKTKAQPKAKAKPKAEAKPKRRATSKPSARPKRR